MDKKGLLVVSFGTSFPEVMKENITPVEESIAAAYPGYVLRRAFTSGMIIRKLKKRDGVTIDTVEEALQKFSEEGFTELVIQPTLIIHGYEFDLLMESINRFRNRFSSVRVGYPILHAHEDYARLIEGLSVELGFAHREEAFVLMGHGTEHFANACYPAFEHYLHTAGHTNVFMGTVEGYPELDDVRKSLKEKGYRKVSLTPLMLVAGDHAKNDMAGEEDSWKTILEGDGLEVCCILRGLGSYRFVQEMYADHAREAQ